MPELVREWYLDPGPPPVTISLYDDGTLRCTCYRAHRRPGLLGDGCAHVSLLENFAAALWDTRVDALGDTVGARWHRTTTLERLVPPAMRQRETRTQCKNYRHTKAAPQTKERLIHLPEDET